MNEFTTGTVVWQAPSGRLHVEAICPIRPAGKTRAVEILDLDRVADRMCDCFYPHWLVGERVTIPAHLDAWMAGHRFGTVIWIDGRAETAKVRTDRGRTLKLDLASFGLTWETI